VLDVNLGEETSEAIALELNRLDSRFITVSGYASDQNPAAFDGSPRMVKPLQIEKLIAELLRLTS
jgi:hypothetical protein